MKVPMDSANWITKIGFLISVVFLGYFLVFWAETSLNSAPERLTEAIAQHPTDDELKDAAAYATRVIAYTSAVRGSVGVATMFYTLLMLVLWGLCSRKIRKTKKSLQREA